MGAPGGETDPEVGSLARSKEVFTSHARGYLPPRFLQPRAGFD